MGIDVKVTGRLDKNNVIVEASAKDRKPSCYKVPINKADEFITNYKKNEKKVSIISNTAFFTSILAGVVCASALTKNLKSNILKWVLNSGAGIVCAIGSMFGCAKYIETKNEKLLKQHNAIEI